VDIDSALSWREKRGWGDVERQLVLVDGCDGNISMRMGRSTTRLSSSQSKIF